MRAVIDACVLYPTILREIVTGVAAEGLFQPLWSARILGEWRRAVVKLGPVAEAVAEGEIALLRVHWPGAEVPAADDSHIDLPDPADRHVVATAIAGGAEVIVTLNLRDFPARALAAHGLRAEHPDSFLLNLYHATPGPVARAVETVRQETERVSGREQPLRPLLKRANLPRLGKALSA